MADSGTSAPRSASAAGSVGFASAGAPAAPVVVDVSSVTEVAFSDEGDVSSPVPFFDSFNRCSRPSTRFSRASKTSVFGPRFFGTASVNHGGAAGQHTPDMWATSWSRSRSRSQSQRRPFARPSTSGNNLPYMQGH